MELIRTGLKRNEVAEILDIAPSTVHKHMQHVFEKLDVHSALDAVRRLP